MKKDVFPRTQNTWIGQKLREGQGGRSEINRHVMSVYSDPLKVYFLGMPYRWLGEPDDLVQGFFADRLGRGDFFDEWLQSNLRLRRWLMNGFGFYVKEQLKSRRRDGRAQLLEEDQGSVSDTIENDMDRAFAVSLVREALVKTHQLCQGQGLESHWEIFYRHYYEGLMYRDFVAEFGVNAVKASDMARTVAGKFRAILREIVLGDGALESEVDEEIENFLQLSTS